MPQLALYRDGMLATREAARLTLAQGTARLRVLRCREDSPGDWWEAGHAVADLDRRRSHVVLRPIAPDTVTRPGTLRRDAQCEYFFDGGRTWIKAPSTATWGEPLGFAGEGRRIGDPTWVLDALLGASDDPGEQLLDLRAAARVLGVPVDIGQPRVTLLWRRALRAWLRALPARVWLDAGGRLARVEHLDPPPSRLFAAERLWNAVEFGDFGEPEPLAWTPDSPSVQRRAER